MPDAGNRSGTLERVPRPLIAEPPGSAVSPWTWFRCAVWDGWYHYITLAMLAHAYLAAVRDQALEQGCQGEKGLFLLG